MPLTMRPTGVESPVDKIRQDFTIFSGRWEMGRIYEDRSGPLNLRWFWSLHGIVGKPLAMRTDGRARRSTRPRHSSRRPGGNGSLGRTCERCKKSPATGDGRGQDQPMKNSRSLGGREYWSKG